MHLMRLAPPQPSGYARPTFLTLIRKAVLRRQAVADLLPCVPEIRRLIYNPSNTRASVNSQKRWQIKEDKQIPVACGICHWVPGCTTKMASMAVHFGTRGL